MNLDYVPSRLTWHYNLSAINNFSFEQYPLDDGNGSTNDWFMASGNGYPIANPSSIYGTSGVLAWELKSANSTQLSDVSQVIQGWTTNTSGPVTLFMQGKGKVTGTGGTPNGSIGLFDGNNNLLCYLNYTTSTLTYKSTNCTVPQNTASLYISGLIQATSGATNWILDIDNVGLRLV
jgi:hypothetical protein